MQGGDVFVTQFQREHIGVRQIETGRVNVASLIGGLRIKGHKARVIAFGMGGQQLVIQRGHGAAGAPIFAATQS